MAHVSDLIANDIEAYLKKHEHKSLLRFITCGSVDDGKSTLIGRLLYESKMIFEDHLQTLQTESKKFGTHGDRLDFALLVDGLAAEREQGITIDVAYRFFSTDQRKFIVADTPGHEQYTRNMVTGASTADLAIVLVDARKGILTQTKRHTTLVNLVGIQEIVLAVNKMDLMGYRREVFDKIVEDYRAFTALLGITKFTAIPMSALEGDNITARSIAMDWYSGPTLMGYLESVPIDMDSANQKPMRFPVQWVNRPNQYFRGYAGSLASGSLKKGDAVRVTPSGQETKIKEILLYNKSLPKVVAGQAITVTLEDEIDISRGDILCDPKSPLEVSDQFEAKLVWMAQEPLHPGRSFRLKCGTKTVNATVTKIKYQLNVNTLEKLAAEKLDLNAVAVCNLSTDTPLVFDPYLENKTTGSFILIDRHTNNTVAAGMIDFALRRAKNITPQAFTITQEIRALALNQKPKVFWFTGLSGSGKSTIANAFEQKLHAIGKHTYILDGDNLRHGLNRDLGFTETDRVENIRRTAEVAKLMVDAGLIVLVTLISPFRADRAMARSLFKEGEFIEVFMDTPLQVAEQRDPKGLYAKTRKGEIKNFTGIDSPYEKPLAGAPPELTIKYSDSVESNIKHLTQLLNCTVTNNSPAG
ncbi:sulfate adenylyltransferase subunit CysN [Polynucleobacter sp. HIN6]|uniref:sulfate adenylyltransferase subunit CysN n=1 Tax=Polynucleobacter sp. HIN6 TaxID=3047865 RepID=UPI002572CC65|nr:sulfate adenylyltransferase subunit CysN [Polynucleobacter sp. HIN6]BEI34796.1 sulfate adenylyltransferase subunit CysN [Polynucleobacter sp. HIN6]